MLSHEILRTLQTFSDVHVVTKGCRKRSSEICLRTFSSPPKNKAFSKVSKHHFECKANKIVQEGRHLNTSFNFFQHKRCVDTLILTSSQVERQRWTPRIVCPLLTQKAPNSFHHLKYVRHFSVTAGRSSSSQVPSAPVAVNAVDTSGLDLAAEVPGRLFFPDFPTINGAESAIMYIHDVTGLPWWLTIVGTAFLLRVVLMLPLTVYSFHNAARLERLQPEVKEIAEKLKVEVSMAMGQFKWSPERAREEYIKNMKRLLRDLYVRDNCHPMKNTATFWLQTPVWFSVSYALRNLSLRAVSPTLEHHEACASLTEEGALWFPDLTITDTTWALPIMMGAVTLFNIEMTHLNISEVTKYRKRLTIALRGFALLFIPLSATLPSAMVLYWVSSGAFAAGQNLLYDFSPFRRLARLPVSKTESNSPFKSLSIKAKKKYFNK